MNTPVLPKRIKVRVTDDDIAYGRRQDNSECPIALALIRRLDEIVRSRTRVSVGSDVVDIGGDYYVLSERAGAFIARFDSGLNVEPATFVMTRIC